MANEDVKISVAIDAAQAKSGAAEAKQAVDAVAKSTASTGDAGAAAKQAGNNVNDLGKSAHKAGDELFDFHKKGEKLVKEMLAILNPSLAQGADFALDLAEGVSKITPALISVAAAGAAIGIITAIFQQANAEAAAFEKRLTDRLNNRRTAREAVADQTANVANQLAAVGIGDSDAARRIAVETEQELVNRGGNREIVQQSRVLQRMFGLTDEDRQRVLAGLVAAGAKPVSLGADGGANRRIADRLLAAGTDESAIAKLREYRESTRDAARRDAHVVNDTFADRIDSEVDSAIDAMKAGGVITNDRDEQIVREILFKGKRIENFAGWGQDAWAQLARGIVVKEDGVDLEEKARRLLHEQYRKFYSGGSSRTLGELEDAARQVYDDAARTAREQSDTPGVSAPVLNIQNINTNVGTLNQRIGDPPAFNPSLAAHEGID